MPLSAHGKEFKRGAKPLLAFTAKSLDISDWGGQAHLLIESIREWANDQITAVDLWQSTFPPSKTGSL